MKVSDFRRRHLLLAVPLCGLLTLLQSVRLLRGCYTTERVIIVGAGAAGLAAARAIASSARSVLVLEAQNRLGGRLHTNHTMGPPVELGAVWIHRADGNVVTELADEYGCQRFPSFNKALRLHDEAGRAYNEDAVKAVYAILQASNVFVHVGVREPRAVLWRLLVVCT